MRGRLAGILAVAALVGAALVVTGCGDDEGSDSTTASSSGCPQTAVPQGRREHFRKPEQVLKPGKPARALVDTSCGSFVIDLETEKAPKTANTFAFLAQKGYYDDTVFFRIAPGYVMQTGDPTNTGQGSAGFKTVEPPPANTVYRDGVVAAAKGSVDPPGTSDGQWFVVTAPADAGIPPDYALIGRVSEGMDVVRKIGALGTTSEQPTQIVVVNTISIETG